MDRTQEFVVVLNFMVAEITRVLDCPGRIHADEEAVAALAASARSLSEALYRLKSEV